MKLRRVIGSAVVLSAIALSNAWARDWTMVTVENISTVQGPVQIDEVGLGGYQISNVGHLIAEIDGYDVRISSSLPASGPAQFILVEIDTGGGSCRNLYRLLDMTPGQKPYFSRPFGNCSNGPTFTQEGTDVYIVFENVENSSEASRYVYDSHRRRLTPRFRA